AHAGRRRHFCGSQLLRPRTFGAADAAARARGPQHPLYRLQIRRELRADAADPRAGRHIFGFHQAMERSMSAVPLAEAIKDRSMLKQKEMIAENYELLVTAKEAGRKVVSTFVPGNLNELIMCFDMANNLPEINAIQNAMRKKSGAYIMEAEKRGQ